MQVFPIRFGTPAYDEVIRLRFDVLRKPLGLEFHSEELAREYNDFHLACYMGSRLAGCAVLVPLSGNRVKMRQVAVIESLRGRGVGTLMVRYSEVLAKAQGFRTMELNARENAVPFYKAMDYKLVGERFVEVTIPHFKMEKTL